MFHWEWNDYMLQWNDELSNYPEDDFDEPI